MLSKFFGRSKELPGCDELFMKYFAPWYDEDSRQRKGFEATRPDMVEVASLIGEASETVGPLPEEYRANASRQIEGMLEAARGDFPNLLSVSGEPDLSWVDAFDRYFDRGKIQKLLDVSDPTDFSNEYVVTCCEFGALLASVMKTTTPRLEWYYEHPYWESSLFDPKTGAIIPPFHFAIKKMSEYGVDDGFAAKLGHLADILDNEDQSD